LEGEEKKTAAQKEAEVFAEFDLSKPFEHTQEEVNRHMVESVYGEEAVKTLKEHGIFYPDMDNYLLIAVTEKRTKYDIGILAESIEAALQQEAI